MKAPKRKAPTRTSRRTILHRCVTRLREPSTYAGLGVIAGALGLNLDDEMLKMIATVGMGVAALAAVVLPERKP